MRNKTCTIDNCGRYAPHATPKRCCNMHYRRWWRYGTFEYVRQGKRNPNKSGYILIGKNGKQLQEHRLIMEAHLGRKLMPFPIEVVHHINGNRSDNRLENLVVISQSEHSGLTPPWDKGVPCSEETKRKISENKKGKSWTEARRKAQAGVVRSIVVY